MTLDVHEIFYSIQGETTLSGLTSVFVRLAGCNLRCIWCDTRASLAGGALMQVDEVLDRVCSYPRPDHVTITGGEPLLQKNSIALMRKLLDEKYVVQLETNGSISLDGVPPEVRKIVDIKPPSSGHAGSFLPGNLGYMGNCDELKIVVADEKDLRFAEKFIMDRLLDHPSIINLSPAHGTIDVKTVADFIMRAPWGGGKCRVRLNMQLHKTLNLP